MLKTVQLGTEKLKGVKARDPSFNELEKTDYYSNLGVEVRNVLGLK